MLSWPPPLPFLPGDDRKRVLGLEDRWYQSAFHIGDKEMSNCGTYVFPLDSASAVTSMNWPNQAVSPA